MDNFASILLTIFGGIITLAIVSVIVSRKSNAPEAIHAIGGAISNVVAAAVNPVSETYGYGNGNSSFSSAANGLLTGPLNDFTAATIPGISK